MPSLLERERYIYICTYIRLVVSTPLQLGLWFPIYGKIQHVPNHQPVIIYIYIYKVNLIWTAEVRHSTSMVPRSWLQALFPQWMPSSSNPHVCQLHPQEYWSCTETSSRFSREKPSSSPSSSSPSPPSLSSSFHPEMASDKLDFL